MSVRSPSSSMAPKKWSLRARELYFFQLFWFRVWGLGFGVWGLGFGV